MKIIRFIPAFLLCSILFLSCTNNETEEELQLLNDTTEIVADVGDESPPPPPPDPNG